MPTQNDKLDLIQEAGDKVAHEVIQANAEKLDGAAIDELAGRLQSAEDKTALADKNLSVLKKTTDREFEYVSKQKEDLESQLAALKSELKATLDDAKAARSKKNKVVSTAKPAADYRLVRDLRRNDNVGERTCCSCTRRKPSEFMARCGERCLECA